MELLTGFLLSHSTRLHDAETVHRGANNELPALIFHLLLYSERSGEVSIDPSEVAPTQFVYEEVRGAVQAVAGTLRSREAQKKRS